MDQLHDLLNGVVGALLDLVLTLNRLRWDVFIYNVKDLHWRRVHLLHLIMRALTGCVG